MRGIILSLSLLMALLLVLSACAEQTTPTGVIERYLNAQVDGDADTLVKLSCAAWERQAKTAAASFQSVDAKIDGLKCAETGSEGGSTHVVCEGTIVIQYRGEDPRSQPVPELLYLVVKEGGEWKMCGTQAP